MRTARPDSLNLVSRRRSRGFRIKRNWNMFQPVPFFVKGRGVLFPLGLIAVTPLAVIISAQDGTCFEAAHRSRSKDRTLVGFRLILIKNGTCSNLCQERGDTLR